MILRRLRTVLGGGTPESRVEVLPDRVWISARAKYDGIRRVLEHGLAHDVAAVGLVAHFPDVLAELERIVADHGSPNARAFLARRLSADAARDLPLAESVTIELIVAERHPLRAVDDELVEFASALPCRCLIMHHLSLDDPLMRRFAAGSVGALLERMGAKPDEPIVHTLIDRSIRRAQEKIAADVRAPMEAASAADWMERNAPAA